MPAAAVSGDDDDWAAPPRRSGSASSRRSCSGTSDSSSLGSGSWPRPSGFARNDLARITIHRAGLPRFAAACTLLGHGWLGVSGALWIALGFRVGPPLLYDAALHSSFLGFAISMVMGHTAIILPAVLRVGVIQQARAVTASSAPSTG